jgi:simple sugar transport system permease protein
MSESDPDDRKDLVARVAQWLLRLDGLDRVAIGITSTTFALGLGLVIVAATGHSPVNFVSELLNGVVGSERGIAVTLRESVLFILAGVSVAIAFRAGIFNIGVHGQLIVGGLTTAMTILYLAPYLPENALGGWALMLTGTVTGIVAGGLYAALPGVMKAYADANEIITTIMLNFIAIGVVKYLLSGPFQGEEVQAIRTATLPEHVRLPKLVFSTGSFSIIALVAALVVVVLASLLLIRTRVGYDMVTSGQQERAARYSGVEAKQLIVGTMTLSGMIAGLAGAIYAIMVIRGFVNPEGISTYGFDAIAVSLLAGNNPLGVVPAGILFGGLARGGSFAGVATDVPAQLIDGVVGFIVLFVAAPELFRAMAKRWYQEREDE